jgi:hypothetical protein
MCCLVISINNGPTCNIETVTNTKVGKGKGIGKGRLPIGQYHAELLLMGCMAWFDNKRRHFLTWVKNLLK